MRRTQPVRGRSRFVEDVNSMGCASTGEKCVRIDEVNGTGL
jgi:hypothetical protein